MKQEVERGKYLVEDVATCGECHTPRNSRGELKGAAWLRGATI
jgi:mono/diheme cytochrome c family protein